VERVGWIALFAGEGGADGLNEAAEFIPEEKEAAIRVVEDISGLFADETEVDRDENSPALIAAK
jgi:hypothetical protein